MQVVYEINFTTLSVLLGWVLSVIAGAAMTMRMKDRVADVELAIAQLKRDADAFKSAHELTHRDVAITLSALSGEVKMHRENSLVDFVHTSELNATEARLSQSIQSIKEDLNAAIRSVGARFDDFVLSSIDRKQGSNR